MNKTQNNEEFNGKEVKTLAVIDSGGDDNYKNEDIVNKISAFAQTIPQQHPVIDDDGVIVDDGGCDDDLNSVIDAADIDPRARACACAKSAAPEPATTEPVANPVPVQPQTLEQLACAHAHAPVSENKDAVAAAAALEMFKRRGSISKTKPVSAKAILNIIPEAITGSIDDREWGPAVDSRTLNASGELREARSKIEKEYVIVSLKRSTKRMFMKAVRSRGLTMQAVIAAFIEFYIRDPRKFIMKTVIEISRRKRDSQTINQSVDVALGHEPIPESEQSTEGDLHERE